MSQEKIDSQNIEFCQIIAPKEQQKGEMPLDDFNQTEKNQSLAYIKQQQQKTQNPKIGRPAKTDQQQEFKKCYLQNKQKFQLECQLLVFIHQNYFDEIIDNPINARISKEYMDRLFVANKCESTYQTLLKLNEDYFKNSSFYPQQKLKYTSLIDVAYMCHAVKEKQGQKMSAIQLLLIIFFYLYNEKLVNRNFYDYFVANVQKFREGMIFGPGAKNAPKLQKLDKLVICLALTLADLQKILIEQEILYSEEEYSQSSQEQEIQESDDDGVKKIYLSNRKISQKLQYKDNGKPRKKFHQDR